MLPSHGGTPQNESILSRIVGVGDSLTAGYQSNGFLGATGVRNPNYTGEQVPPNQENGFWADLVEQASGNVPAAIEHMYDPAVSPLPLIKGPGLDNQLTPTSNAFEPFGQLKTGDPCTENNDFNLDGFRLRTAPRTRMNPDSTAIRDFGVPGLTLHEANVLHQPQTSTCKELPGIPGLLSQVVSEESGTFWPVLLNFSKMNRLTEVGAAASVHPTLATVWLGANDWLKYMGSGGRFVGGDRTAGQVESDLRATIATLQHAGAKVVVANLPDILETGLFERVTLVPQHSKVCRIRTYASCFIGGIGGVPNYAIAELARTYNLDTPHGCTPASTTSPCGYVMLPGAVETIQYFSYSGTLPNLDCAVPAPHCKAVPGSGLGMRYITPEFAGKLQALNNAINQGIDNAASASHVPLVDIHAIFHGLASGDPSNKYFALASSINPGHCCTLGFLWGISSFDGIHPSNTGYALVTYAFIDTINQAYGTHIPQIDLEAAYKGTRCGAHPNKHYCFPDPYAPPND